MIRFQTVSLGSGSVSPCVRCGAGASAPYDASRTLGSLSEAVAGDSDGVVFTGFEPFAHPSLVELIGAARGLGAPRIGVQTDGAALGVGQNAPGSIGAGVRFFEFVFLGADAEAHDRLVGRPGAFASLNAGVGAVRRLSTADQRVFAAAVTRVCRHNVAYFVEVVAAAAASGVRAIRVEVEPGVTLPREMVDRAHVAATTSGIALFGDGCDHLLGGATLYTLDPSGGEVPRG